MSTAQYQAQWRAEHLTSWREYHTAYMRDWRRKRSPIGRETRNCQTLLCDEKFLYMGGHRMFGEECEKIFGYKVYPNFPYGGD